MKPNTVDEYVKTLDPPTAAIVNTVRQIIRQAAPTASEAFKWGQPVYEENGPFAWIRAFRNHVSFGFWRGVDLADPEKLLEGRGDRMRHVKITGARDIKKGILKRWVREAANLNRAKGNPTMANGKTGAKKKKGQDIKRQTQKI